MKILAFSDWRTQKLDLLKIPIAENRPDYIIYGGDDLERVLPIGKKLLFKNSNDYIFEMCISEFVNNGHKHNKLTLKTSLYLKSFLEKEKKRCTIESFNIPYVFTNGNDDKLFHFNNTTFLKIDSLDLICTTDGHHHLKLNKSGKLILKEINIISPDTESIEVYTSINALNGDNKIAVKDETITISIIDCDYGLIKEANNIPTKYSDIYLSHLPPHGTLDYSIRYTKEHIGSKLLRNAIVDHQPKIVICGHSHLWGGSKSQIKKLQSLMLVPMTVNIVMAITLSSTRINGL